MAAQSKIYKYRYGFTPLESPAPRGGDEYNPSPPPGRAAGFRTLSFLTGFTLIEMLVYAGIVAIVISITIPFLFSMIQAYTRFRTEQVVVQNSKVALDTVIREVKSATGIYWPTSVFSVNPGQLSLFTRLSPPTDETDTYVDFYVDGGRLYRKAEGGAAVAVTSERITVSQFIVRRLNTSATSDFIQLTFTFVYNSPSQKPELLVPKTFTSGAAIRGQY